MHGGARRAPWVSARASGQSPDVLLVVLDGFAEDAVAIERPERLVVSRPCPCVVLERPGQRDGLRPRAGEPLEHIVQRRPWGAVPRSRLRPAPARTRTAGQIPESRLVDELVDGDQVADDLLR